MKNFTFMLTIIVLSVFSAFGQNSIEKNSLCTNESAQKISSRGINIGANVNDIITLFAATEEEKQLTYRNYLEKSSVEFGSGLLQFSPNQNPQQQNEKFVGISDYVFYFLDNRLTGFNVSYTKPVWADNEQFTSKMAEIFDLPNVKNWTSDSNGLIRLQCGNYAISTQTFDYGRSSLSIYDNRIGQILVQRRRKAADEQREKDIKVFKP